MRKLKDLEELIVDHLEGELDSDLKRDVDLMMKGDQSALSELKIAKEVLKQTDDIDSKIESFNFDGLHSNIMARLENEKMESKFVAGFTQKHVQARLAIVASLVLVVGVVFGVMLKHSAPQYVTKIRAVESDILVLASANDPDAFADTLISDQDDSQFLLEAAAQKISQLDSAEAERVLNQIAE